MSEGYASLPAYYVQSSDPTTPHVGFSLIGMDPIIAANFVLADTAIGSGGSSVKINGVTVSNPNFNNTTPAAPTNNTNVTWQVDGSGNVSAYLNVGVTSITGDGTIFNNSASTGAVTLTLTTQTANTILAGPISGSAAAPTFRTLVLADIPTIPWSSLGNAAAGLILANGAFTTEFDQTSNVAWTWKNTALATVSVPQSSPTLNLVGSYWNGAVSLADTWTIGSVPFAGASKPSQLVFSHSGASGVAQLQVPAGSTAGGGLVVGSTLNTGGSFGPGLFCPTPSIIGLHPGDSSGFAGSGLRFYSVTPSTILSFALTIPSGGSGATLSVQQNINSLQQVLIASAHGTGTGIGLVLGGNGGNNGKYMSATSGTSTAVAVGGPTSNQGFVNIAPAAGSGNFTGFLVNPTINASGAQTGTVTDILVQAVETNLNGFKHNLLDLQAGAAGTTALFTINNSGLVSKYLGLATVGTGVSPLVAAIDLTAQGAAIAAGTALYAVPAAGAGLYRVSVYAKITTAGTTSTLGGTNGFQLTWTDPTDSTTPTAVTFTDQSNQSLTGNTTTTVYVASAIVACKASTNLQYGFDYTSTGTAMQYKISIKVEYLG